MPVWSLLWLAAAIGAEAVGAEAGGEGHGSEGVQQWSLGSIIVLVLAGLASAALLMMLLQGLIMGLALSYANPNEDPWKRRGGQCKMLLFFSLQLGITLVMLLALFAAILYGSLPCDQPLRYYFLAWVCVTLTLSIIEAFVRSPTHGLLIFSSWIVVIWGLTMVHSCETCPATNPRLYYPTKYCIYAQAVVLAISSVSLFVRCGIFRTREGLLSDDQEEESEDNEGEESEEERAAAGGRSAEAKMTRGVEP